MEIELVATCCKKESSSKILILIVSLPSVIWSLASVKEKVKVLSLPKNPLPFNPIDDESNDGWWSGYALLWESFMNEKDRMEIIYALECVDEVLISCDEDASVCKSLELAAQFKPMADLIFAKGGDRNFGEVPEVDVCEKLGIEMVDNLGEKIRSSSEYTGLKQIWVQKNL